MSQLATDCSRKGIWMGISNAESHLLKKTKKNKSASVLLTHTTLPLQWKNDLVDDLSN